MRYILLLLPLISPALAGQVVTVGVNDFPPCVIVRDGVEAVVFDSPAILAAVKDSGGSLELAGDMFDDQRYGIAMPPHSKLIHQVDQALLELTESDRYEYLRTKWLGKDDQ